jgi:phosphoglycerate dehydrogenase-like enzyme
MATKIVLYDLFGFDDATLAAVRKAAPGADVVVSEKERLADELRDAEIFYGFHTGEVFRGAERLRWIQTTAAGIEQLLDPVLAERGVQVTNASGVHAGPVAETAWAMTLALTRGLPTYFRQQQSHQWERQGLTDLDGATAGIIGLGGIGRRYARVAAAFGMRVIAVDRHEPRKPDFVESLSGLDRLDDLLAESDFVLVSCPYTPETHHLINRDRLSKMKPTAFLVNIARGGIVDEAALIEALRAGRLAGAGLDVCETEPLPADSPLWDVPNLVLTPHCAGLSAHRKRRLTELFCANLKRYQAGDPLENLVDQTKGYPVPGR